MTDLARQAAIDCLRMALTHRWLVVKRTTPIIQAAIDKAVADALTEGRGEM